MSSLIPCLSTFDQVVNSIVNLGKIDGEHSTEAAKSCTNIGELAQMLMDIADSKQ